MDINYDKTEMSFADYIEKYKEQIEIGHIQKAYRGLIEYLMKLRTYFSNKYSVDFVIGNVYQGYMDITYFPFTPIPFKKQKLKIAIVFNHMKIRFEIWLVGQNRQIQKKYWKKFKNSDWDKYHIPESIREGFSIVDHMLIENPGFNNLNQLTKQIESGTIEFIKEIADVLD
jgi:hypothetical protein